MRRRSCSGRRLVFLVCLACFTWVGRPAAALLRAMPLPEMVQKSSLIARVRVLETHPTRFANHYRSVATVRLLEVLKGKAGTEVVQVRFDNGETCPNVYFKKGEECLLFAEEDIDGCFLPVNLANGKKKVEEPAYAQLSREIRRLSIRARHEVSLLLAEGSAGDPLLDLRVTNKGVDPLTFSNDVRVEFRDTGGRELELNWMDNAPTIIVELDASQVLVRARVSAVPLTLESGETCRASLRLKELAHFAGKQRLRVWAKLLGQLSDQVSLEVDFGIALPELQKKLAWEEPSLDRTPGPFRFAWGTRLHRFCRRNLSALLILCVAAGCLLPVWVVAGWRRGRARCGSRLVLAMCIIPTVWTGKASAQAVQFFPLPELVQRSSLVARVQVADIKEPPGRITRLARARLLEVLRGTPADEFIEVRCGYARFEEGEECLIFAEQDLGGQLIAVGGNGKMKIEQDRYGDLAREIRRLSIRARHSVSLRSISGSSIHPALEVLVINEAVDPLEFPNDAVVQSCAVRQEMDETFHDRPIIIVELEAFSAAILEEWRFRPPRLKLERGEACRASLDLNDLLPQVTGRQKLRAWAKVLGRISEPVLMEVDFGDAPQPGRDKSLLDDSPGPFQLTWTTRLYRLCRRNLSGLLILCVAAGCLLPVWVVAGWRRSRARRSACAMVLPGLCLGLLLTFWTGAATADKSDFEGLSLPDLVQGSALIARVEVVGIGQSPPRATVRLVEVLRGESRDQTIQVNFGDLEFVKGEECLLFAEEGIDGRFLPVARQGKLPIDQRRYAELSEEIRRLSSRRRHAVSLRVSESSLTVEVTNHGADPLKLVNDVRIDLRPPPLHERPRRFTPYTPVIILELEEVRYAYGREGEEALRPRLFLEPGEACEASFDLKTLLRHVTGKQKLRAWARVLGRISEPVSLELDFGNAPRAIRLSREDSHSPGPFQLTWGTRLHRFYRRNLPALWILCAVAGCLLPVWVAAGWRRSRLRRSGGLP